MPLFELPLYPVKIGGVEAIGIIVDGVNIMRYRVLGLHGLVRAIARVLFDVAHVFV